MRRTRAAPRIGCAQGPGRWAMLETMHAIDPKIALPMMRIPRSPTRALPLVDRLNHAMLALRRA